MERRVAELLLLDRLKMQVQDLEMGEMHILMQNGGPNFVL